jgi:hypothetical protein
MRTVLAWLLAAMAVYYLFRAIALDDRLWGKRREGASRWKIWIPPRRSGDVSQTDAGSHTRHGSRSALGLAVLIGLLALALSSL